MAAGGERTYRLGGDELALIVVGEGECDLQRKAVQILGYEPPTDCAGHDVFAAVTLGAHWQ
jgi:hypothetical protein